MTEHVPSDQLGQALVLAALALPTTDRPIGGRARVPREINERIRRWLKTTRSLDWVRCRLRELHTQKLVTRTRVTGVRGQAFSWEITDTGRARLADALDLLTPNERTAWDAANTHLADIEARRATPTT